MTRKQWDYVMSPIIRSVLPKSGIARTFPHAILYAPSSFTGLGLIHPYYKQNLKKIDLLLCEALKSSITENLTAAITEQLRLELGINNTDGTWQIHKSRAWMTTCWFKPLLQFCHTHDLSIHDTSPLLEPLTTKDIFIMEAFADNDFNPSELLLLNQCRTFLHAVTLSDLCTADLLEISWDALYGKTNTRPRKNGWPRMPPQLSNSHWQIWQKALTRCFLNPASQRRTLQVDLGTWLPTARTSWEWFYSPEECRIYHKTTHSYKVFSRNTTTRNRSSTSRFTLIDTIDWSLPSDCLLATITRLPMQQVQLTSTSPLPPPTPPSALRELPPTIHVALQSLPMLDRWAVLDYFFPDDGQTVAEGIISGSATAVSDGSFKSQFGTSGFVIRGNDRRLGAIGVNGQCSARPTRRTQFLLQ
jgi:hypothetical protein